MMPEKTAKDLPLPPSWLLQSAIYFQEKEEPRSFLQNGFSCDYAQESFFRWIAQFMKWKLNYPPRVHNMTSS